MNITYAEYHRLVVDACVELTGEDTRVFWDTQCDYEDSYIESVQPNEAAQNQVDAL